MISGAGDAATAGEPLPPAPTLDALRDVLAGLAALTGAGLSEAEIIDHLEALERLKSGCAAAQARLTATLAGDRAAAEAARGVRVDQRGPGLAAEIGLARRESPVRGARHLGLAKALVTELPHTLAALTRGDITEWQATLVARETAVLSAVDRIRVDRELAAELPAAGDRQIAQHARAIGYRLDPGSAIRRVRGAHGDRRVSIRPAPDTMTYLTGFLPVAQGVACQAALTREAEARKAAGDPRSRGQIMADTLVERITGQSTAAGTPVEINVIVTDQTLLGGDHTPGHLHGYGPVPGALVRELVREADKAWVRRLYTDPERDALVAMDSHRRLFPTRLRRFLVLRDQICRTPWCEAPIRHTDHISRAADGGPTTAGNGQGLCETCNHAKEAPGWRSRRLAGQRHRVRTTTPTGHDYDSRAPDPPGRPPVRRTYDPPLEICWTARSA